MDSWLQFNLEFKLSTPKVSAAIYADFGKTTKKKYLKKMQSTITNYPRKINETTIYKGVYV